ncbi:hypothetical protein [Actinomadura flavalba]|uniref:hypothetical protein n=1 Tax=Actinomadura flavalba TaxID=1120938 RepID=UPI00036EC519|nr:hypothetical protein [Actinomadura flavalba]
MLHLEPESDQGLIESQGINAGGPIGTPLATPAPHAPTPPPPDRAISAGELYDEQVGLPGQLPGHPGQQRSLETS